MKPDDSKKPPRPPMVHELKIEGHPFEEVASGRKPYEVRTFDRDFRMGDALLLLKWDPVKQVYSGDAALAPITYVTEGGNWGLPPGLCVLGLGYRAYVSRPDENRGQRWQGTGMARVGSSE